MPQNGLLRVECFTSSKSRFFVFVVIDVIVLSSMLLLLLQHLGTLVEKSKVHHPEKIKVRAGEANPAPQ